jgi:hypothetical protein
LASNFSPAAPMSARLHLRVDRPRQVDVAEHLQLPGVAPGRLVDLVDRAAGNVAGIVDQDVDVGGVLRQAHEVLALAQVDDMRGSVDLVRRTQAVGERLQLIAAAGGEEQMTAFLGKGFGGRGADALRCAGDEDALAAQMQIHGITRCSGGCRFRRRKLSGGRSLRSTLHCSVARGSSLVHCKPIK